MNRIILSRPLARKLAELPKLYEETVGVLFANINNGIEFYSSLRLLGIGEPGEVTTDREYTKVANTIIDNDRDAITREFHTHSRGTVQKYRSYYAEKFSRGDLKYISKRDIGYAHFLVTPETIRLVERTQNGIEERGFEVMDFTRQDEWNQYFVDTFEFYRKKLGIPRKSSSVHLLH